MDDLDPRAFERGRLARDLARAERTDEVDAEVAQRVGMALAGVPGPDDRGAKRAFDAVIVPSRTTGGSTPSWVEGHVDVDDAIRARVDVDAELLA